MPIVILTIFTILTTWYTVADARKRSMNAVGWGVFTALTSGAALPFYLMARKTKAP